jgi:hypothetical protein
VSGRGVFDGFAGTRTDSFPSLSIANGAPTGADATNALVLTWPDGDVIQEKALVQTSVDRGLTWSTPVNAAETGDQPDKPAAAISPDGTDLYLVYNGYLDPFRTSTRAECKEWPAMRMSGPVASRRCIGVRSATRGPRPGRSTAR